MQSLQKTVGHSKVLDEIGKPEREQQEQLAGLSRRRGIKPKSLLIDMYESVATQSPSCQ